MFLYMHLNMFYGSSTKKKCLGAISLFITIESEMKCMYVGEPGYFFNHIFFSVNVKENIPSSPQT